MYSDGGDTAGSSLQSQQNIIFFLLTPVFFQSSPPSPVLTKLAKSEAHFILPLRYLNIFQSKYQCVINLDLTKLKYSFESPTSHFLKGEQMFLLSSLFSFCCRFLLQSADAPSVLLCLSVLGPGHGQSLRCSLSSRTSTLNRLLIRRKPTDLLSVSKTLVLLAVALFEPFSDQEPLYQQSPVGDCSLFFFLESGREEKVMWRFGAKQV